MDMNHSNIVQGETRQETGKRKGDVVLLFMPELQLQTQLIATNIQEKQNTTQHSNGSFSSIIQKACKHVAPNLPSPRRLPILLVSCCKHGQVGIISKMIHQGKNINFHCRKLQPV